MQRYTAVFGFNTKQWWAYDEKEDCFCDPPTDVLDEIENYSDDIDEQGNYFEELLASEPDWLNDEEYRYDCEI